MNEEKRLWLDYETYSATDIKCGVYRYTEDPEFLPIMLQLAVGDGDVELLEDPGEMRLRLEVLWRQGYTFVAHNAQFERVVTSRLFGLPTGQYLDPARFHDTMMVAAEKGYPRSLMRLSKYLGGELKSETGKALIRKFCRPNKDGKRNMPSDFTDDWMEFCDYGVQDVVALRDIDRKLGMAHPSEHDVWVADQTINDAGIRVDLGLAVAAEEAGEENLALAKERMTEITGLDNPGSVQQLTKWLSSEGEIVSSLRKDDVTEILSRTVDEEVKEVLELRREVALVAHKKFTTAIANVSEDGRLRGQFRFFGAHTGRWTGSGVQLQNLARPSIDDQDVLDAIALDLKMGFGASNSELKSLVRYMFQGPFNVTDYSAIEARVLAWMAGEEWVLQAFREGRDLYVETAKRMGDQYTRKEGKVAVLALGYQGAVDSLAAFGFGTGGNEDEDEALQVVKAWRAANRNIVRFWYELEEAFVIGDGTPVGAGFIRVEKVGTDRHVYLPSGRPIIYHRVRRQKVIKVDKDGNEYEKKVICFDDPTGYGAPGQTYGGRLTENVTQAVARDLLAAALVRLTGAGYKVVGHVHDEVLVEIGEGGWVPSTVAKGYKFDPSAGLTGSSVRPINALMCADPGWARGLPLNGEGFETARYRK